MDVSVKLLPDLFTLSLLWVALLGSAIGLTSLSPSQAIIACATIYIAFIIIDSVGEFITKKEIIGGGDIKIMAAFGALFGAFQSVIILFLACVVMLLFIGLFNIMKKTRDKELPFGLGLTIVAIINIFYPAIVYGVMDYFII